MSRQHPRATAPLRAPRRVGRTRRSSVVCEQRPQDLVEGRAVAACDDGRRDRGHRRGARHVHRERDLGLDRRDPLGALDAFSGEERRIDVGRVDGVLFLNNVSLGAYARLVHRRERRRRRGEALAAVRALGRALRTSGRLHARLDGRSLRARVVLVANNHYQLDLFSLGERERLDEGVLDLWAAAGVLPTAWEERTAPRFRLDLPQPRVQAAVDGEPAVLESPLEFESLPQALRVLLPDTSR